MNSTKPTPNAEVSRLKVSVFGTFAEIDSPLSKVTYERISVVHLLKITLKITYLSISRAAASKTSQLSIAVLLSTTTVYLQLFHVS